MMAFELRSFLSRIRVPAGFLLAVLYFHFSRPTLKSLWAGGVVAFLGILVRAWATGHICKNDELAVSGPYSFTRNPLYFGTFVIGLGFSLAGGNLFILVIFLIGFATLYGSVMQQETEYLKQRFAEAYAGYQMSVPLFFPRLRPKKLASKRFSFRRYLHNREYQALLGFAAALGLLAFKVSTS
jgi:protein-S-isoprenylcysteine O-methyltransferase Ste14